MTDAIASSTADVARALAAAKQSAARGATVAGMTARSGTGRSGHEGDSVTLSDTAREVLKLRTPDGREIEVRPLTGLRMITPQSARAEAEAGIQRVMADLGIEGDLEFTIRPRDDGTLAVSGSHPRAAEIGAAINDDPALCKTLRELHMTSRFAHEGPLMREAAEAMRDAEVASPRSDPFAAMHALRQRMQTSSYTLTMTGGVLSTAFVDPTGQRFGGVAPEAASAS